MQAVKISTEPEAFVGTSTIIKSTFNLSEDTKIYWAGNRLYAKRLCGRDIVVTKVDIFCEGQLQKGEYIREKTIPVSTRVPPSVKERNLNYRLRSEISMIKPQTKTEEEFFFAENPIYLKASPAKPTESNPVELSLKGIKIHMDKDHFSPGEIINIDYELEKFKAFEVDLVKDANITCNCPDYASTCIHIKPKPPAVETSIKASNLTSGTLQLPLPSFIELSHRYVWEPPEKTRWKETFGDYVNWVIEVIGTMISGESVRFQIPIHIIGKQTPEDIDIFTAKQAIGPAFQNILVPEAIDITNSQKDQKTLRINLKHKSKEVLNGVTIKITPIESEFFELPPNLTGVNRWEPGTEITAFHSNIGENINTIQVLIEDNAGNTVNKRFNL
ncbi:MAG: hypothetical protein EU536_02110 [Promethearchaeota archaeon]|nr:MAG: hypothetical protein EU536_02110 [Candidatus Lokiarchaeota archaeon]